MTHALLPWKLKCIQYILTLRDNSRHKSILLAAGHFKFCNYVDDVTNNSNRAHKMEF